VIRASQVLPGVLAEVIRRQPLTPEKVAFAWRLAVGPALAKSTSVRLDAEGVLHVTAAAAPWAASVRSASHLIRTRLDEALGPGVVTRLEIAPAPKR